MTYSNARECIYQSAYSHFKRRREEHYLLWTFTRGKPLFIVRRSSFIHCSCSVVWKRDPLHSVSLQVGASLVRSFVFAYLFSKVLHTVILFFSLPIFFMFVVVCRYCTAIQCGDLRIVTSILWMLYSFVKRTTIMAGWVWDRVFAHPPLNAIQS